jgi:serine/threonine protein kinase
MSSSDENFDQREKINIDLTIPHLSQDDHSQQHSETSSRLVNQGLSGKTIGEQYELLTPLGAGGMSVVYKAKHLLLNKIVAIKVLSPQRILDDSAIQRFQQEAKAACHLGHQNIVVTRDFGTDDAGRPYLVMDYISGESLEQLIRGKDGKTFDPKDVVHIISQITAGMAYAHKLGVIHRDIKPANIIVSEKDGEVTATLVDFGIAKIVTGEEGQNLTQTGEVFGSPLYMSPEQCLGKKVDGRSDIYSIGCVMYEMLTGAPPFMGDGALATLMMHVNDEPQNLHDDRSEELVRRLSFIVQKCLSKDPGNRYQTMGDLGADLQRALTVKEGGWNYNPPQSATGAGSGSTGTATVSESLIDIATRNRQRKRAAYASVWKWTVFLIAMSALIAVCVPRKDATPLKVTEDAQNWLNQGKLDFRKGNYAEALNAYKRAEDADPGLLWIHQDKGEAYQRLEDPERASAELMKQLRAFPYVAEPLRSCADTWKEQHNLKKSSLYKTVAECDRLIAKGNLDAKIYEERATAFSELGESKLAELDRQSAAKLINAIKLAPVSNPN